MFKQCNTTKFEITKNCYKNCLPGISAHMKFQKYIRPPALTSKPELAKTVCAHVLFFCIFLVIASVLQNTIF